MHQRESGKLITQFRNNFKNESSAKLLKIWEENDRYSYRDEAFTAIREILTLRKLKVPEQKTANLAKQPKKKTPIKNELTIAILKTVLVFFAISFMLGGVVIKFNLSNAIFDSFLLTNKYTKFGITILIPALCSYFGYRIAESKNRNKQNWAVLCIFLNIWGLVLLGFLPGGEKDSAVGNFTEHSDVLDH